MELTMSTAGLVTFICILTLAIVDLGLVLFGGTTSSVSQFLIKTAFKSPLVSFAFGTAVGHLFFFMYDTNCTPGWTERIVIAGCGAVVGCVVALLFRNQGGKMNRAIFFVVFWFLILTVTSSCGRYQQVTPDQTNEDPQPPPPPVPDEETEVIIAVFGAPWCSACKSLLPAVQQQLDALPKAERAKIVFRLYVTTGSNSSDLPTQAGADKYRDFLHLDAQAIPDPKWVKFREWVSKSLAIPGGAVLDKDGKLLQRYLPGEQFNPRDIVAFARSQL